MGFVPALLQFIEPCTDDFFGFVADYFEPSILVNSFVKLDTFDAVIGHDSRLFIASSA